MSDIPGPGGVSRSAALNEVVAALQAVQAGLEAATAALTALNGVVARSRRHIRWLVVSLILDVLLTAAFAVVFHQVEHNAATIRSQCVAANAGRQAVLQGWNKFFAIFVPDPSQLPADTRAKLVSLEASLAVIYAPKPC